MNFRYHYAFRPGNDALGNHQDEFFHGSPIRLMGVG
jgi:hypothetical protein